MSTPTTLPPGRLGPEVGRKGTKPPLEALAVLPSCSSFRQSPPEGQRFLPALEWRHREPMGPEDLHASVPEPQGPRGFGTRQKPFVLKATPWTPALPLQEARAQARSYFRALQRKGVSNKSCWPGTGSLSPSLNTTFFFSQPKVGSRQLLHRQTSLQSRCSSRLCCGALRRPPPRKGCPRDSPRIRIRL